MGFRVRSGLILAAVVAVSAASCRSEVSIPSETPSATPTAAVSPFWGTGVDGNLDVSDERSVSPCVPLLSASGTQATVDPSLVLLAGDRVLLVQTQATSGAGTFDVARVAGTQTFPVVQLSSSLAASYLTAASSRAQICRVPQFDSLHLFPGGSLVPETSWSTQGAGGIVAVLARTVVVESGASIAASGRGSSAGVCSAPGGEAFNDAAIDASDAGTKAEGIDVTSSSATGRGARLNAGGGGNANDAGGGGGGNGGAGGAGGRAIDSLPGSAGAAGQGGGALPSAGPRLLFGGGGGGGHRTIPDPNPDGGTCYGGWGGGVVFVLSSSLSGGGILEASGGHAIESLLGGGSGGGAGGTVFVEAADWSAWGGLVRAPGGRGGNAVIGTNQEFGPGGGGGGGRVYVDDPGTLVVVTAGGPGVVAGGSGVHGSSSGSPGIRQLVSH